MKRNQDSPPRRYRFRKIKRIYSSFPIYRPSPAASFACSQELSRQGPATAVRRFPSPSSPTLRIGQRYPKWRYLRLERARSTKSNPPNRRTSASRSRRSVRACETRCLPRRCPTRHYGHEASTVFFSAVNILRAARGLARTSRL